MADGRIAGQYHVTTSDKMIKIVDVTKVPTIGQYQIVNNGQTGNQYDAKIAPAQNVVRGGTRHKKRFRSKTRRIKPSPNVKRR
uniref:Uncharacterized protein n=1 Tax=viral metagenome TaxID=1070528 RepID=A0A6C0HKR9_9ZZZZ